MTKIENKEGIVNMSEQDIERDVDIYLNSGVTCGEGLPSDGKIAELARKAPEPVVIGSSEIEILSHSILKKIEGANIGEGVVLNLKNNTKINIGLAVFSAIFYDVKGNIIDTVEKSTKDFGEADSRILCILSSNKEIDIKSYNVKLEKVIMTPVPSAVGNEDITILNHSFQEILETYDAQLILKIRNDIELSMRNVSNKTIATTIFEVTYYDSFGNVMGKNIYKEYDLKPNTSRAARISAGKYKNDIAKSYSITVIKTISSDIEKVIIYRKEISSTGAGKKMISGILKNISSVSVDTGIIATFLDGNNERIGMKVLPIMDIKPDTITRFNLNFTPQEGDLVKDYLLDIGEVIREENDLLTGEEAGSN